MLQVNKLKGLGIFLEKVTREELKSIVVKQKKAGEFEKNHKIIVPQNVVSSQKYFYDDSVKMFRNFHKKERTRGTIPI